MPGLSSWSPPIHEVVIQSCRFYDGVSFFFLLFWQVKSFRFFLFLNLQRRWDKPSIRFPSGIRAQASPVANGRVESRESPVRAGPSRPTPHIRGTWLAKAFESETAHWPYPMYAGLSFAFAESGAKPVRTARSRPLRPIESRHQQSPAQRLATPGWSDCGPGRRETPCLSPPRK